ncbi:methyl-CpG-binding domain-containing protein 5-like [Lycium barbarum]|uniref:methyl-CpG-binding domain-containing protein 5-like n=1 Tax=Lycium barbarum TaxID=112863 RepID=UPI00293E9BE2|nr:methyl-CpG-binding domain-containing protein 5-like [Lycium barbarum]
MTEPTPISSIPPETVTGGDDSLPPDPLLQSGTYIDADSTPNKDAPLVDRHVSDLPETTPEMTAAEETVTPVKKQSRSAEVNVERPSWLPESWKVETRVRTSGATAGTVDRYYYEPVSGRKFRSKNEVQYFLETGGKRKKGNTSGDATTPPETTPNSKKQKKSASKTKKITSFYFDSANPPQSMCWIQTDSYADTWAASCNGSMVPETRKQEWAAVFSTVSHLRRRKV